VRVHVGDQDWICASGRFDGGLPFERDANGLETLDGEPCRADAEVQGGGDGRRVEFLYVGA